MKAHKLRCILQKYGTVKNMYLRKEPMWRYKARLDKGGRKGRLFIDGWAEFEKKKDAKFCEEQMNSQTVEDIKGRWANDIWLIKYLPGFKWTHLQEALEAERRTHQDKVKEENEKARETSKKWLKQTKTAIATGGKMGKPKLDEEEGSDAEEDVAEE